MPDADAGWIHRWPEQPALPACGQAVVVRIAAPPPRPAARRELRAALRQVLAAWSGLPARQLPLEETPRGPIWRGQLCGETLDVSLSYGTEEAWIGLIRGAWIGIDVMSVAPFDEADDVARYYLGAPAAAEIRQSANPALAFAAAWTEREARLKCLKQGLVEWTATQSQREAKCLCRRLAIGDHLVGAVSWRSNASKPFIARERSTRRSSHCRD